MSNVSTDLSVSDEGSLTGDLTPIAAGGPTGESSNATATAHPSEDSEKRLLEDVNKLHLEGRSKRKPICGAEKKRRRKARWAASGTQEAMSSTSGGSKRRLTPGETPPDSRQPEKKPKVPHLKPSSYAQAVESSLRVAIVSDGYPETKLSEEQSAALDKQIWKTLVGLPPEVAMPNFHESRLVQGAYMISCANDPSKEWLKEAVKSLKPWEGAKLHLVEQSDLPKLKRMLVWIPGETKELTEIYNLLERQNPGLCTRNWRLFSKTPDPQRGSRLVIGVDEASVAFLKTKDFRPFLGMKRVTFVPLEKSKEKTDQEAGN